MSLRLNHNFILKGDMLEVSTPIYSDTLDAFAVILFALASVCLFKRLYHG